MKSALFFFCFAFHLPLLSVAKPPRPLPICPGDEVSKVYSLRVNGVEVPVGLGQFNGGKSFHVAAVEINSSAQVVLQVKAEKSEALKIRPRRHQVDFIHNDGEISFKLLPSQKLVLEVPGQQPLVLIALPVEEAPPNPTDPNVLYFGPGEHAPGQIRIRSGQQLYLAAGARVRGTVYAFEAKDIVVRGRGVLDARGLTTREARTSGLLFERCQNINVEGIQVRTGDWWQILFLLCDNVQVSHLHTMSFGRNNDGIDIDGVTNIRISDSFIGCGDDGFGWHALDAVSFGEPPTRNCKAERCVIWNEHAGNGLRIGASMETQIFEDVVFRDIDVLHAANNAIKSDHSDWAHVKRVLFERFDNDTPKPLADMAIGRSIYSNKTGYRDERGRISSVLFRDVRSSGGGVKLRGAGTNYNISDIGFVRCQRQGKPFTASDVEIGPYVNGIQIESAQKKIANDFQSPAPAVKTRQPKEMILDNGHTQAWAFAGNGLQTVPCHDAYGGEAWLLNSLGSGHAAVYEPQIEGLYQISVHWGTHTNVATKAPWTVKHAGGYTTKVLNQNNSSGWKSVGTYQLNANSWVRLVDPHYTISDGPVVADAVRFKLIQ